MQKSFIGQHCFATFRQYCEQGIAFTCEHSYRVLPSSVQMTFHSLWPVYTADYQSKRHDVIPCMSHIKQYVSKGTTGHFGPSVFAAFTKHRNFSLEIGQMMITPWHLQQTQPSFSQERQPARVARYATRRSMWILLADQRGCCIVLIAAYFGIVCGLEFCLMSHIQCVT